MENEEMKQSRFNSDVGINQRSSKDKRRNTYRGTY